MSDAIETAQPIPRAILVGVQLESVEEREFTESLDELARLSRTLGHEVVGRLVQRRASFDHAAYLGPGKLGELAAMVNGAGGPVVLLVDHEISPSQARNLEKAAGAPVLDRTAVILEIFHRHARSRQAKAQVEMVRLQYMAPRMRELGAQKKADRVRGGVGGKGAGESAMELDRRKIRDRIAELKAEIEAIADERGTQRARRRELRRVALVGYTNAGKSTLMRALTGSEVYVADQLFATLDTTVRALDPPTRPRILISDTVGFIRNLPHGLVASFKSTLDEALEASLILHVVDASDPAHPRQMEATEQALAEIGAGEVPRKLVWNKIDRIADPAQRVSFGNSDGESLAISAKSGDDVARVRASLIEFFERGAVEAELLVGYDRMALRNEVYERCQVLAETSDERGTTFKARAQPQEIERLRALLASPTVK
jgi:GTP-binding protein HflX